MYQVREQDILFRVCSKIDGPVDESIGYAMLQYLL